jgi:dedicated sortase system histidine kinase
VSLRWQLILVSLLTLVLPWAGCQYVEELESVLRKSEESSLLTRAAWMAKLLEQQGLPLYGAEGIAGEVSWPASDLYAWQLDSAPQLDGYAQDWEPEPLALAGSTHGALSEIRYLAGVHGRYLYLHLDMPDDRAGTQVVLALEDRSGRLRRYRFPDAPPGPGSPTRLEDDTSVQWRIQANRQETAERTLVEMRIPVDMVEGRMGFLVQDGAGDSRGGSMDQPLARPGRLVRGNPDLDSLLGQFSEAGQRVRVVDTQGWLLAQQGGFPGSDEAFGRPGEHPSINARIYRMVLDQPYPPYPVSRAKPERLPETLLGSARPGQSRVSRHRLPDSDRLVLSAAVPIKRGDTIDGALLMERQTDRVLTLADQALSRLINLSLLAGLMAALGLLAYASYLSLRIRRLRDAASVALSPGGRLRTVMPGTARADELGDLSRSFQGLLRELDEYTRYLKNLGDTLAHELRTPMTVVKSSLDNLQHEQLPPGAMPYLERADEGVQRLQRILTALRAAARIEQSVRQADMEPVDLAGLLRALVQGYRDAFPARRFELGTPEHACTISGSPELLSQMLDKLVENAVEFSPDSGLIRLTLEQDADSFDVRVANQGSALPPGSADRLFDSLVSVRNKRDTSLHLGLGLHIVKLIAEHHGGRVRASNSEQLGGAEFTVCLTAKPFS